MRALLALALALLAAPAQDDAPRPPDARTTKKLVDEALALDLRAEGALVRRDEILARLELAPPIKAKDVKKWRKRVEKALSKRATLDEKPGFQLLWPEEEYERKFRIGGDTRKPTALFVGLHGGRKNGAAGDGCYYIYNEAAEMNGWLAVFPIRILDIGRRWSAEANEEFVLELIERALRTWDIDPNNVYMAGHSAGGGGTWWFGAHQADRFAAVGPSAGYPPSGTRDPLLNFRNLRAVAYHGAKDPIVGPEGDRRAAREIAAARETYGGFDFEYWEEAEAGHEAPPGGGVAHLGKLAGAPRDPRPARVVWSPLDDTKRRFYWLRWEAPQAGTLVVADADREANTIALETRAERTGFAVLLDDALVDLERPVTVTFNGETAFEGRVEARLATLVRSALEGDTAYLFAHEVRLPD